MMGWWGAGRTSEDISLRMTVTGAAPSLGSLRQGLHTQLYTDPSQVMSMNGVHLVLAGREVWGLWQRRQWMFYPKWGVASLFQLAHCP